MPWKHLSCGRLVSGAAPPMCCPGCAEVAPFHDGWLRVHGQVSQKRRKVSGRVGELRRARIFERDGWRCVECGLDLKKHPRKATIDHRIPKSRGGTNADDNLQAMCFDCNQDKRDLMPDEHREMRNSRPRSTRDSTA